MENELNITPFTRTPWRWSEAPGIDLGPDPSPWLSNETGPGVWPGQGCSGGDLDVKPWTGPEFPERPASEPVEDLWPSTPDTARKPGSLSRWLGLPAIFGLAATLAVPAVTSAAEVPRRPNIVVLLGDDMGFSDMGAFGSEIKTPNLDSLAKDGVRFTTFYTHASCSPTRSMFLSGVDTHLNGLGNMSEFTAPNQMGVDGYEGDLNDKVVTLPQLLKDAGYHTYMVGKWHLGKKPSQIPAARGFERDFTLLDGMGSYWDMWNFSAANPQSLYTEDGKYLRSLPKNFYATKTYTDKLIGYIDANHSDGKPFFAYVSHQAPHEPYHLPKEWRNRHVGEYDKGWDALRAERLKREVELGIMPPGTQLAERMWFIPDPILLAPAARAFLGKKMEIYAGMVENLDYHVGRLIDHLKQIGEYENTIFIVFGDNGAEGNDLHGMIAGAPGTRDFLFASVHWSQTNPNAWGDPGSWLAYGPMWAQVSMTPFSQYKAWLAEGGIRNALIVSGPLVSAAQGEHRPPGRHARGRHHAHAARGGRHELSEDLQGERRASGAGQVLGPRARGPGRVAPDGPGCARLGGLRQPRRPAGELEAALGVQAPRQGGLGALRPLDGSGRAEGSRRGPSRQAEGDGRALGRLRPEEQRGPAQPLALRDSGRPASPAGPGPGRLSAAQPEAPVRAAQGHDGRSEKAWEMTEVL